MTSPRLTFLICGSQKSGTSALDRYLRQHPQLFLPKNKELHFFDNENLNWPNPDLDRLHIHFQEARSDQRCGEATPITMYWDPAPERVWHYNPAMKLVILLRDPVTRAYSHWSMEHARGADQLSFRDAIALESQRAANCRPRQDRVHSYSDRGFYCHQIRRLWRLFGEKNVLVIRQAWLQQEPQHCLNRICKHLEVDAMPPVQALQERVGTYQAKMDEDIRFLLQQRFRGEVQQLEQMLNWDCSDWLEAWR